MLSPHALHNHLCKHHPELVAEKLEERRKREAEVKRERRRINNERRRLIGLATNKTATPPPPSTPPPLKQRVPLGEFYWIPADDRIGAYKVKEVGDTYDDYNFKRGWYYATEEEATKLSAHVQKY